MATLTRLNKELQDIRMSPPDSCSANAVGNDLYHWRAEVVGPEDTPFEGGTFHLDIKFNNDYPFRAPVVIFTTRVFHPNIDKKGNICLDILKDQWSPALSISKLLLSILSLLSDPNPDDPLDPDAAKMYKDDRDQYNSKVREYTETYAK